MIKFSEIYAELNTTVAVVPFFKSALRPAKELTDCKKSSFQKNTAHPQCVSVIYL